MKTFVEVKGVRFHLDPCSYMSKSVYYVNLHYDSLKTVLEKRADLSMPEMIFALNSTLEISFSGNLS